MKMYKTKYGELTGSSYEEVAPHARKEFQKIRSLTKRQPYVRSQYFSRDKIFLSLFWEHLAQKHRGDKVSRLKLYVCALELLRKTAYDPETIVSAGNPHSVLHRFAGETKDGRKFFVQVKQDKRTGRKDFMSVFPAGRRTRTK